MADDIDFVGQIRANLRTISGPIKAAPPKHWRKRDYLFWGVVGFLGFMTVSALILSKMRIDNPEWAAEMDAQYAQQQQARIQKATQAEADEKQKREEVRAALLSVKKLLIDNVPSYLVSYSAANSCVEIARDASNEARAHGEDDLSLGFINIQMKCDEWASLNWNAGRP